ncbi:hypothetical protein [Lacicoccus qingdaonensis]|uniref:Uncharacterized protein n=1 Tax=Lacicoccus qingdaonensis TaxID=576118 RepID=A0A1G9F0S8_9BACL|nr:hypothetical protein [Salinicoccus qingdaonensis]SDK82017.1 hypothetical protein SAMN05216216_11076 [Salinicoccus qingdaonensis]
MGMNAMIQAQLNNSLHGILNCRCEGNCLLKSIDLNHIDGDDAFLEVEPYDAAFNQSNVDETIDRTKRVLLRRRKAISRALGVKRLSVNFYDEWTMKDAFVVDLEENKITSSVN